MGNTLSRPGGGKPVSPTRQHMPLGSRPAAVQGRRRFKAVRGLRRPARLHRVPPRTKPPSVCAASTAPAGICTTSPGRGRAARDAAALAALARAMVHTADARCSAATRSAAVRQPPARRLLASRAGRLQRPPPALRHRPPGPRRRPGPRTGPPPTVAGAERQRASWQPARRRRPPVPPHHPGPPRHRPNRPSPSASCLSGRHPGRLTCALLAARRYAGYMGLSAGLRDICGAPSTPLAGTGTYPYC